MRFPLKIAARASPLSQAQVREVFDPLGIPYEGVFVSSYGDLDLKTSLRGLDKTDFFTREVDELVLSGVCDLSVHSAKDLPETLPKGLKIAALTKGVDPSDSLVLRENETLEQVHLVATSSEQREAAVREIKSDVTFCDIRGPIHERLAKLYRGEVDAIVIAEAALLRLHLNPNRLRLPGTTTPLQGQLAICSRQKEEFSFLPDVRPKETLYFGLRCSNPLWHHFPLIETFPLPFKPISGTHYIFTSQIAVELYRPYIEDKPIFCVGKATAKALFPFKVKIAAKEQAEGVIELLEQENLERAHVVWPRSDLARDTLSKWLKNKVETTEIPLYTTKPTTLPKTDITPFSSLMFTSPSTIDAFKTLYGPLPHDKKLITIGQITENYLKKSL